jgi:hypothetical protein
MKVKPKVQDNIQIGDMWKENQEFEQWQSGLEQEQEQGQGQGQERRYPLRRRQLTVKVAALAVE